MELTSEQMLPVEQATAWDALNDINLLQQSIPGCETLLETGPGQFDVVLLAAVGPVKARFKGKLQIEDAEPPRAYTIRFDGQGGAAGFGKGNARVELEADGPRTLLRYVASAQVGGKIAQVGSRLVDMAARKMAGQFFETFSAVLVDRYPDQATAAGFGQTDAGAAAAPPDGQADDKAGKPSALAKVKGWFKGSGDKGGEASSPETGSTGDSPAGDVPAGSSPDTSNPPDRT